VAIAETHQNQALKYIMPKKVHLYLSIKQQHHKYRAFDCDGFRLSPLRNVGWANSFIVCPAFVDINSEHSALPTLSFKTAKTVLKLRVSKTSKQKKTALVN
jgi:hypothetical protein